MHTFEMAEIPLPTRDLGRSTERGNLLRSRSHHVWAMAEALGREVPASKYSPSDSTPCSGNMSQRKMPRSLDLERVISKSRYMPNRDAFDSQNGKVGTNPALAEVRRLAAVLRH